MIHDNYVESKTENGMFMVRQLPSGVWSAVAVDVEQPVIKLDSERTATLRYVRAGLGRYRVLEFVGRTIITYPERNQ